MPRRSSRNSPAPCAAHCACEQRLPQPAAGGTDSWSRRAVGAAAFSCEVLPATTQQDLARSSDGGESFGAGAAPVLAYLYNRTRRLIDLDFESHGMGKALVPLVLRPQARKELPRDEQTLKNLLEQGVA